MSLAVREKIMKKGIKGMFESPKMGYGHWKKKEKRIEGKGGRGGTLRCRVCGARTEKGFPFHSSRRCLSWSWDWTSTSGPDSRERPEPGFGRPTFCH